MGRLTGKANLEEREYFLKPLSLESGESGKYSTNYDEIDITSLPKSKRLKFIFLVLLTLFIAESSRGMVVVTLYFYLTSVGAAKEFVGVVVAVFSVGRMLGGFVFGYHYNKRGAKEALAMSIFISICGHVLYSVGENQWIILFGRFLAGLGTGILSVVRACISASTTKEERSRYFSYTGAVQFLGFAVVPGFSSLLAKINFNVGTYNINEFNAAGYLLAITNVILMILILVTFLDIPRGLDSDSVDDQKPKTKKYYYGIILFILLNFVARGIIALLETVGTPVFIQVWQDEKGDYTNDTSLMFLILGCVGLVIFIAIPYVLKLISEKVLLFIGFVTLSVGSVLLIEYKPHSMTLYQFIAGASCIWSLGSPIVQTIVISSFSKMLGSKPQGVMMGLIAASGSLGRILFPLLQTVAPNNINFIVSCSCAILCSIFILTL